MAVKDAQGNIYYYIEKSLQLENKARIRLWPWFWFGDVTWTIDVEYRRHRGDRLTRTKTVKPYEWFYFGDVVKGNNLCGGKATLNWEWNWIFLWFHFIIQSKVPTICYIRGENPTEGEAQAEISNGGCCIPEKYVKAIARRESGYQYGKTYLQFNIKCRKTGDQLGPEWDDYMHCPNYGAPNGWGIMKVDPPDSVRQIWDWKENIQEGKRRLIEKQRYAQSYLDYIARKYPDKYEDPPSYTPPGTNTELTHLEAATIQLYNGASIVKDGQLSCWKFFPENESGNRWKFVRNSDPPEGYVKNIVKEYEKRPSG